MIVSWKTALLLFVPLIILSGYLIKIGADQNTRKQEVLNISKKCSGDNRVECLSEKIISYISEYPDRTGKIFEIFWELEKNGELTDDPRIFSDVAHEAGMTLVDINISPDKALVFCGATFKQGCIHGVVMEYIDSKLSVKIGASELFDFCRAISRENHIYLNCLHGVGHGLLVKNKTPIETVLDLCGPLHSASRFACESGVLMEYSKGTVSSSFHTHAPVGKKELPCVELDDKYKSICYASAGSYRQYEPAQEDIGRSYDFCFSIPKEYVDDCLNGLSERVILASAENQEKLNIICEKVENNANKSACMRSIQRLIDNKLL